MKQREVLLLILAGLLAYYFRDELVNTGKIAIGALSRGVRNNNPGNIQRTSTVWQGMSADQSKDSRFVVFDSPEYGIRALARILQTYASGGINTVRGIINRWAPPTENDTNSYVNAVAKAVGVSPDAPINVTQNLTALVTAIIKHENGSVPYSLTTIADGIRKSLA